ncbi:hypothetical protein PYCC9005_003069 [Savitreella phatthalungensis]
MESVTALIREVQLNAGLIYQQLKNAEAVIIIGIIGLFFASWSFANFTADFVLPGMSLSSFGSRDKDCWAIVTGASDGIGAEFAKQLAKQKFNILLVSRTQSKLDALAEEIEGRFGVKTKTLAIDASLLKEADFKKLDQTVSSLPQVGVLVNNVGQSHDIPVPFDETPVSEMRSIIDINIHFTLRTTQICLKKLSERKSLILTMGSFGGYLPTPLLATYSGSKAFLETWSIALASELRQKRPLVTVKCVNSYLVTSKMSKIRKPSLTIPTPSHFVSATLMSIKGSSPVVTPHWAHHVMAYFLEVVGRKSPFVVEMNRKMHLAIRKRALKKKARTAATSS